MVSVRALGGADLAADRALEPGAGLGAVLLPHVAREAGVVVPAPALTALLLRTWHIIRRQL